MESGVSLNIEFILLNKQNKGKRKERKEVVTSTQNFLFIFPSNLQS